MTTITDGPLSCLFAVILAPIAVSVGSSRLSLRETALCWSPLTDRVRGVAARALRRAKATECVDGVVVTHVNPTLLGWPVEQVEWLNRTRKRADARNEEARKCSANVPTGQTHSL